MAWTAAVAGATGYAGGELLRLLLAHPDVRIGVLSGASSAGDSLGQHQPHLTSLAERTVRTTTVENLAGHDVVFLALPHGRSAEIAAELTDTLVIDLAADHRLTDPEAWQRWYDTTYAGSWPYGLPELPAARDALRNTQRIAVPGCFPIGGTLALTPAFAAGIVQPEATITAVTGTSGAGKSLKPHLLGSEVMGSVSAYGVGGRHRHTPEFTQNLSAVAGEHVQTSFTPVLAPMPRGILTTANAPLRDRADLSEVREAYDKAYADEPFVQMLPADSWPATASTTGSNVVQVQVTVDADAGRLIAVSALDNLTKGTAGTAVQAMNIALGIPETTGLPTAGMAP